MGAGKWSDGFEDHFKGARICIIPDNDQPGRNYQELYAAKLAPVANELVTLELPSLPEKGDLSDFIQRYETFEVARKAFDDAFAELAKPWVKPDSVGSADQENDSAEDDLISENSCALGFIDQHKELLRYCHGGDEGWFIWEGQHWRRDTTRLVFNMFGEFIQSTSAMASPRDRKAAGRASFYSGGNE